MQNFSGNICPGDTCSNDTCLGSHISGVVVQDWPNLWIWPFDTCLGSNCTFNICPCDICLGDICLAYGKLILISNLHQRLNELI